MSGEISLTKWMTPTSSPSPGIASVGRWKFGEISSSRLYFINPARGDYFDNINYSDFGFAVDGCHFVFEERPRGLFEGTNSDQFMNRKNRPSLNVQIIGGKNRLIFYVDVRAPGRMHDAHNNWLFFGELFSNKVFILMPFLVLVFWMIFSRILTSSWDNITFGSLCFWSEAILIWKCFLKTRPKAYSWLQESNKLHFCFR